MAWTGPWSPLPGYIAYEPKVTAVSSLGGPTESAWKFAPFVAGTAILASWLIIALFLRPDRAQLREVFASTFRQMWGALLVGPFIFGLADVFSYSGMANSMASGFSKVGTSYIVLAPILGWIAVALSGSNTSANAVFGQFQLSVGKLLHAPLLIFPSLNSVGAEVGKPVAPQTASVGVATTKFVRNEGAGDPVQHGLDPGHPGLPDRHRLPVLLRVPVRDAPVRAATGEAAIWVSAGGYGRQSGLPRPDVTQSSADTVRQRAAEAGGHWPRARLARQVWYTRPDERQAHQVGEHRDVHQEKHGNSNDQQEKGELRGQDPAGAQ